MQNQGYPHALTDSMRPADSTQGEIATALPFVAIRPHVLPGMDFVNFWNVPEDIGQTDVVAQIALGRCYADMALRYSREHGSRHLVASILAAITDKRQVDCTSLAFLDRISEAAFCGALN